MFLCVAFTTLFSMLLTYTYNCCEQYFPEKTNSLKIQFGWYGLKAYTKIMNVLDKITIFQKNIFYQHKIILLNNGIEVITFYPKNQSLSGFNETFTNANTNNTNTIKSEYYYDFVLYEFIDPVTQKENMVLSDRLDKLNDSINDGGENEKSDVRFLNPCIEINNTKISFVLDDRMYLTNNILFNKSFIKWFLNKYPQENQSLDFSEIKNNFTIHFFDNNMDYITINSNQMIVLGKQDYTIITNIVDEVDDESADEADEAEEAEEAEETDSAEEAEEAEEAEKPSSD